MAPQNNPELTMLHDKKGTRAMPIKLVAYLMAVDTFPWSAPKHGPTNSPKKPALTDAVRYLKLLREKSHSLARDTR